MLYHTTASKCPVSNLLLCLFHSGISAAEEDDTSLTDSIKVFILFRLREKFADPAPTSCWTPGSEQLILKKLKEIGAVGHGQRGGLFCFAM